MRANFGGLGASIAMAAARQDIPADAMNAMFAVLTGAPLLRPVATDNERALGQSTFIQTLDSNGDILVSGRNYLFQGKRVKALREEFGSGNVADTYQRVYFLNSDLQEDAVVVDGKYPNGVFNGAVYRSPFAPVDQ